MIYWYSFYNHKLLCFYISFYQYNTFCSFYYRSNFYLLCVLFKSVTWVSFLFSFENNFLFSHAFFRKRHWPKLLSSLFWSFVCQSFQIVSLVSLSLVGFALPKFCSSTFSIGSIFKLFLSVGLIISVAGSSYDIYRNLVIASAGLS
jgi:hypothetical protein